MKATSKAVFAYLQSLIPDVNVTADDVAEALDMSVKSVNGAFTASIQRKDLGYRQEAEVELEDGTHKKVKFLKLNEDGYAFNLDEE